MKEWLSVCLLCIGAAFAQEESVPFQIDGILLVTPKSALPFDKVPKVHGIEVRGLIVPGDLEALRSQLQLLYFKKEMTLTDCEAIKQAVSDYYAAQGWPVVSVALSSPEVANGTVQIIVEEQKKLQVQAYGARWFSNDKIAKMCALSNTHLLTRALSALNRNPFRHTEAVYTIDAEGQADIELITKDRFPLRVYAGADNTGVSTTGRGRFFGGFEWGNAFFCEQRLLYQYTTSANFQDFQGHTLQYIVPLPWLHFLNFYGGYSTVHAHLPLPSFKDHGMSAQLSARYEAPITASQELLFGFDFKRTDNSVGFARPPLIGVWTNLTQLMFGYRARIEKQTVRFGFKGELFYAPGPFWADQRAENYHFYSPSAKSRYLYGKVDLDALFRLPAGFAVATSLQGQLSTNSLLPSELLGIGGYNTVRGYEERQVNTDDGLIASTELHLPSFSMLKLYTDKNEKDCLLFLLFLDYGIGAYVHPHTGKPRSSYLLSSGPGLRYTIDRYFDLRLDWGIRIHRHGFGSAASHLHFGLTAQY